MGKERLVDLIGQRFNGLSVVERVGSDHRGEATWRCRCEYCGGQAVVRGSTLRRKLQKSCGCLRTSMGGASRHPLFHVWRSMIARCHSPKASRYDRYGARGISVCARWRDSFRDFLDDMGPRPEGHSIDRIDNDGNYEPGNCRWATDAEQARTKIGKYTVRKLSPDAIREMRSLRAGGHTIVSIAATFGVTEKTASRAISGKTWADVT